MYHAISNNADVLIRTYGPHCTFWSSALQLGLYLSSIITAITVITCALAAVTVAVEKACAARCKAWAKAGKAVAGVSQQSSLRLPNWRHSQEAIPSNLLAKQASCLA